MADIKHPLLMQGLDLATVLASSIGTNQHFDLEQQRGDLIGVDFVPFDHQFVGSDLTGKQIDVTVGGQQIIRNGAFIEYYGNSGTSLERKELPVPIKQHGGQTLTARITNNNAGQPAQGQLAVFYENPYDTGDLNFDVNYTDSLTLKKETFIFNMAAGASTVGNGGQFTVARGYGNVVGIQVQPTSTLVPIVDTRLCKFDLKLNGVEYMKNVVLFWFQNQVIRRFGIFPVDMYPSSTNQLIIDNSANGDAVEIAVTLFFKG